MYFFVDKRYELVRFQESNNHLIFRVLGDCPRVLERKSKSDFSQCFGALHFPVEIVKIFCLKSSFSYCLKAGILPIHSEVDFIDLKSAVKVSGSFVFTCQLVHQVGVYQILVKDYADPSARVDFRCLDNRHLHYFWILIILLNFNSTEDLSFYCNLDCFLNRHGLSWVIVANF